MAVLSEVQTKKTKTLLGSGPEATPITSWKGNVAVFCFCPEILTEAQFKANILCFLWGVGSGVVVVKQIPIQPKS